MLPFYLGFDICRAGARKVMQYKPTKNYFEHNWL